MPSPYRASPLVRTVLQLGHEQWGKVEALKAAYRRLSVRWHPDKNPNDAVRANAVFVRVAAAYNTLTTSNFDYQRRPPR